MEINMTKYPNIKRFVERHHIGNIFEWIDEQPELWWWDIIAEYFTA